MIIQHPGNHHLVNLLLVFDRLENDGFLLAIRFNKVPDKTVVWSANGNSLVAQGSKVELTADGQLLLNDIATGKDILVASVGTGVVAYAAMLDTGNFVLANAHSNSLWESLVIQPIQSYPHRL